MQKALWASLPWMPRAERMHEFITATKQDLILKCLYTTQYNGLKTVVLYFSYREMLGQKLYFLVAIDCLRKNLKIFYF